MGLYAAKSAALVAARIGLSDKAARCLTWMALESMDKRDDERGIEPRRFFGGRDSLAIAVGYVDDAVATPAARAAVKRAIAQLVDNDIVQIWRLGYAGFRTEYYLRIRSDVASPEVLPALDDAPAKRDAGRTPVPKTYNGLRTRNQRALDPQVRKKSTPGVPQEVRQASLQGHAGRGEGARQAVEIGTPGVPPNRSDQEDQEEQHVNRTRVRA